MPGIDPDLLEDMPTASIEIEIGEFDEDVTRRYTILPAILVTTREMPAIEVAILTAACSNLSEGDGREDRIVCPGKSVR